MAMSAPLNRLLLLSKLRLPEHIFIAAYFKELNLLLPNHSKSYLWTDRNFNVLDLYDEFNQAKLSQDIQSFIKNHALPSPREIFKYKHILTNDTKWRGHPFRRLYRQCFLANGYHQSCVLPVTLKSSPHGLLILSWQKSANQDEVINTSLLESFKSLFVQGLLNSSSHEMTTYGWRSGLIIVDIRGEMKHCCPEGKNLLAMAVQKKQGNLTREFYGDIRSIPGAMELIAETVELVKASDKTLVIKSLWGSFQINAYPVHDENGQRESQVVLNITWQVPLSLLLFQNISSMSLTPKQETIGLLYARGDSNKSIANELQLSLYTVKDHIQHIFEKMQIHTRAELIENILCQESENNIDES